MNFYTVAVTCAKVLETKTNAFSTVSFVMVHD